MNLSERLQLALKERGITVSDLHFETKISTPYLKQLLDGKRKNPTLQMIHTLSRALNIPITYLVEKSLTHEEASEILSTNTQIATRSNQENRPLDSEVENAIDGLRKRMEQEIDQLRKKLYEDFSEQKNKENRP